MKLRKIIHFDMDYFYAQVEIRDNPTLQGKPVAIGGLKNRRGVLCTCNYEARKFGVHSAMPTFQAIKKCPELIVLPPNFEKYQKASELIFNIFREYTDKVQGISLDEAYLDVTNCERNYNSATLIAKEIQKRIHQQTGLTGSAGVSYNKLLAKIASDLNKPNGLVVFTPEKIEQKIKELSVKKIWGVGNVTYKKMQQLGLITFSDLQSLNKLDLINHFGSMGPVLYDYCRGIDYRSVSSHRQRKSLSVERTFHENLINPNVIKEQLKFCYAEMKERLKHHFERQIKNIFIKIKYADFHQTTIEKQSENMSLSHLTMEEFEQLFIKRFSQRIDPIRLIGTGVRFYHSDNDLQLCLPL